MKYHVLSAGLAAFVFCALSAHADSVIVRGREKPIFGDVKFEDAKTVVVSLGVKKGEETIPSVDVVEILYDKVKPGGLDLKGGAYKVAKNAEKEAGETEDAAKRNAALTTAIAGYTETLKKMERTTKVDEYAARHMEYKVAILGLRIAADQAATDKALAKLQAFKSKAANSDSWQNNQVLPTIGQLQLDAKDFKEAEKTYQEMADMDAFTPAVRQEAELKVVEVNVRAEKFDLANKRLDLLAPKAAKNPVFASRIKMARAEVLVGMKKFDEAIPLLQAVVKENNDKTVKAFAHNTLGECLFKAAKYNEAVWEFLWVDAVFNQDKGQHAKALYFLWKTFEQLNNAERAQECREMLIADRQFSGTEYQRLALAQAK